MNEDVAIKALVSWYELNCRPLPWRETPDPYSIWISETMLQQTTVKAVVPYFERFLKTFPDLASLANSKLEDVFKHWAGLGYYSRARNLHKAARALHELGGFPETSEELIKFPGFGPYTSRSVASLAFEEPVGVVDGNTIRVFSRLYALDLDWWQNSDRRYYQNLADHWASFATPSILNQALMELGATICRPQNPSCLLCPLSSHCQAFQTGRAHDFPKKRPRRAREIWVWQPEVRQQGSKVLMTKNKKLPFLKGQWLLPGCGQRLSTRPEKFDFQHSITHHDIYVRVQKKPASDTSDFKGEDFQWVPLQDVPSLSPVALIQKALSKLD